jgi:outer membrane lipoprotein SlyB
MKKLIVILAATALFAACGNKQEKTLGTETTTTAPVQPVVVKHEVRYVNTTPAPAPVSQKKGWSKAAKGTAIGAGSGAIIGAIAGKGKGAIIGGVVGAGTGYVIGRSQDKKDGRVKK